jgi:hypothetical protein
VLVKAYLAWIKLAGLCVIAVCEYFCKRKVPLLLLFQEAVFEEGSTAAYCTTLPPCCEPNLIAMSPPPLTHTMTMCTSHTPFSLIDHVTLYPLTYWSWIVLSPDDQVTPTLTH